MVRSAREVLAQVAPRSARGMPRGIDAALLEVTASVVALLEDVAASGGLESQAKLRAVQVADFLPRFASYLPFGPSKLASWCILHALLTLYKHQSRVTLSLRQELIKSSLLPAARGKGG